MLHRQQALLRLVSERVSECVICACSVPPCMRLDCQLVPILIKRSPSSARLMSCLSSTLTALGGDDATRSESPRRRQLSSLLEELMPGGDFSGVRIHQDRSMVQMGADGDITLARSDLAELLVLAQQTVFYGDVHINGSLSLNGNFTVNGQIIELGDGGADCKATFRNCQEPFELGCPAGVYSLSPDGYTGDEPVDIYCHMQLNLEGDSSVVEPGGWALVYRYTFNNYDDFDGSTNYVDPIPSWHDSGNWTGNTVAADSTISTDAPLTTDEYGAVVSHTEFQLFQLLVMAGGRVGRTTRHHVDTCCEYNFQNKNRISSCGDNLALSGQLLATSTVGLCVSPIMETCCGCLKVLYRARTSKMRPLHRHMAVRGWRRRTFPLQPMVLISGVTVIITTLSKKIVPIGQPMCVPSS